MGLIGRPYVVGLISCWLAVGGWLSWAVKKVWEWLKKIHCKKYFTINNFFTFFAVFFLILEIFSTAPIFFFFFFCKNSIYFEATTEKFFKICRVFLWKFNILVLRNENKNWEFWYEMSSRGFLVSISLSSFFFPLLFFPSLKFSLDFPFLPRFLRSTPFILRSARSPPDRSFPIYGCLKLFKDYLHSHTVSIENKAGFFSHKNCKFSNLGE